MVVVEGSQPLVEGSKPLQQLHCLGCCLIMTPCWLELIKLQLTPGLNTKKQPVDSRGVIPTRWAGIADRDEWSYPILA